MRKQSKFRNIGYISKGEDPERRLVVSLLLRAIADINGQSSKNRAEALAWVLAEPNERAEAPVFENFVDCCAFLGLSPSRIREVALGATRERGH